jgi:hypothetical protein
VSPLAIALAVLACCFTAAVGGMALHVKVPNWHLDTDSRDVVKLVMALIATMSALVLSLLISSASSSYNQQVSQLTTLSANVVLLDRMLQSYGPDAQAARDGLRDAVRQTHDRIWSPGGIRPEGLDSAETRNAVNTNLGQFENLAPKTEMQRMLLGRIIYEADSIAQARLLMYDELGATIPGPLLAVLVFWIGTLFLGFGLLTRVNTTVTVALLVGAIAVAGAVFLVLKMSDPYHGVMRMSDAPLRNAMEQIDR